MKNLVCVIVLVGCAITSTLQANELEDAFKALAGKAEQSSDGQQKKMAEGLSEILVGGSEMLGETVVLECYSIGIPGMDKVMLSSTYPGLTNFVIATYENAPKEDKVKLRSSEGRIIQVRGEVDKADPEKREMGQYVVRVTNIVLKGEKLPMVKPASPKTPEVVSSKAIAEVNADIFKIAPIPGKVKDTGAPRPSEEPPPSSQDAVEGLKAKPVSSGTSEKSTEVWPEPIRARLYSKQCKLRPDTTLYFITVNKKVQVARDTSEPKQLVGTVLIATRPVSAAMLEKAVGKEITLAGFLMPQFVPEGKHTYAYSHLMGITDIDLAAALKEAGVK